MRHGPNAIGSMFRELLTIFALSSTLFNSCVQKISVLLLPEIELLLGLSTSYQETFLSVFVELGKNFDPSKLGQI